MQEIEKVRRALDRVKRVYMVDIKDNEELERVYQDGFRHATVLMDIAIKDEFKMLTPEVFNQPLIIKNLTKKNEELEMKLEGHKNRITKQNEIITDYKAVIEEKSEEIEKLKKKIENLKTTAQGLSACIVKLKAGR